MNELDPLNLSQNIHSILKAELRAGERLVWVGESNPHQLLKQKRNFALGAGLFIAFSVLIFVAGVDFSLPEEISADIVAAAILIAIVIAIVDYQLSQRNLRRHFGKIIYAVSDQRTICISANEKQGIESYPIDTLNIIERRYYDDGSGDLIFAKESGFNDQNDPYTIFRGFFGVAEVKQLETIIEELQASSTLRDN